MIFVAGGVVIATTVLLALFSVGWKLAIDRQAMRIEDYYPQLVSMTFANTILTNGDTQTGFPNASRRYGAYRRVGDAVVPAGDVIVKFHIWGGEVALEPGRIGAMTEGRTLSGSALTPDLMFLEPPVGGGKSSDLKEAASDDVFSLPQFADSRDRSIARLEAAPASSTVEMAVSFKDGLTLQQLEGRVGGDLKLVWGAVRAGDAGVNKWWPQFPGSTLGVPFDASGNGELSVGDSRKESELNFIPILRGVANRAAWLTARGLRMKANYLDEHGFSYYGVVVTGSPESARALALSPDVTTVSLGAVVMPWE